MIIINDEHVTLAPPTGPMRTHIVRPAAPGRYPGIVFYSEIFQITAPIRRTAALLAGHGYIVAMPEIYHEFEPAGTIFAYDQTGSDRGNELKTAKPVEAYDADARAVLDHLKSRADCTGHLGAMGICIGGHLAFRAAMNPGVKATACFYATDIHKGGLGKGMHDDSLDRAKDIHGELLMIWGRQDPHIPLEGRMKVLARLNELGTRLSWHEVNGAHAFMRDEGLRYDPELAYSLYGLVFNLFHRKLAEGDLAAQPPPPPKPATRNASGVHRVDTFCRNTSRFTLRLMAASMYIVVEGEDPGFDTFVNGRSLARHEDALERLALRLGVRPLIEFFSADENSMSLLIEEGAGDQELIRRLPPPQWYAPQDGLNTVRALLLALGDDPQQLGSEGEQVLSELLEYAQVLEKTLERKLRWHLAVSWR